MQHSHLKSNDPVNRIIIPYNTIKSYDTETSLTVTLETEGVQVNIDRIAFFIISNDDETFTNVEDYEVENGTVTFRMPKVERGRYYPQIMDKNGKVYSSLNDEYIDVVYNRVSRVNDVFPMIRQEVVEDVVPQIKQYVMINKDQFTGPSGGSGIQGPEGDKGPKGEKGAKGNRGEKGDKGDKGEKGDKGDQGIRGFRGNRGPEGEKGDAFVYDDFTDAQLEQIKTDIQDGSKGEKGDKGDKGDPFLYEDFTQEQLDDLQGPEGPPGVDGTVTFNELTQEQLDMLTPDVSFELDDNGDLYYIVGEEV